MKKVLFAVAAASLMSTLALAGEHHAAHHATADDGKVCEHFVPQTPRDIDNKAGENTTHFRIADPASKMNLCNIHLHKNAEHKGGDFTIFAGEGHEGYKSGYQCTQSKHLTKAELAPTAEKICDSKHSTLKPGDTIEVHWVHSSCDVKPGKGLGSCSSDACVNPDLRVETAVFVLVNDPKALNFADYGYDGNVVDGRPQAKALPDLGDPVEFIGSTTGPKYSSHTCSPYQVTWNVRPKCGKMDINTVGKFCKGNVFKEDHAHGVRKLVTDLKLLSPIK
ncbi:MAG: delta-class carbonic anhydrase [Mariprofundaceae bacterium]|nr:delta-class carbonic anhydrase [Mariprofundaceae bacterium]